MELIIQSHEVLERMIEATVAAERAARRWLHENQAPDAGSIRAELADPFVTDKLGLVGSRLAHAGAVRHRLKEALREALDALARPVEVAPDTTPGSVTELRAAEQAREAAEVVAAARRTLAEAVRSAEPLMPILDAGLTAFTQTCIEALADLLAQRHQRARDELERRAHAMNAERGRLKQLADDWHVELPGFPWPIPRVVYDRPPAPTDRVLE